MISIGSDYEQDAEFVAELVQDFAERVEQIADSIGQIIETMESVAAATQHGAVNSQFIATSVNEAKQVVSGVVEIGEKQKELAQGLDELIKQFKISPRAKEWRKSESRIHRIKVRRVIILFRC